MGLRALQALRVESLWLQPGGEQQQNKVCSAVVVLPAVLLPGDRHTSAVYRALLDVSISRVSQTHAPIRS
jgi:hypothetical protein